MQDTDFDNLSDYDEMYTHQTNPLDPDTDGDGANDDEEIAVGTNPNVYDANIPLPLWIVLTSAVALTAIGRRRLR